MYIEDEIISVLRKRVQQTFIKVKYALILSPTLRSLPKVMKTWTHRKTVFNSVCTGYVDLNHNMETVYMSLNWYMDKNIVAIIYTGTLFIN